MTDRERTDAEAAADAGITPESADPADLGTDDLPPEAIEEARRWKDVPMQNPEDSTGLDV